jgi:hypothetical protein
VARPTAGWVRYLTEAFSYRWNLLLFGGAAVAAAISGAPDIALPLVAAAEITYLAGITTLPRFQAAIDAKANAEARAARPGTNPGQAAASVADGGGARDRLLEVLRGLSDQRRNRFLKLRARCVEMQRIANAVRGDTRDASGAAAELRTPALDRLLWVFLRLLLSDQAIGRFLQAADEAAITQNLADLHAKLTARTAAVPEADREADRILRSLKDSVATAELRRDNVVKAKGNAEFVATELDRLENKIQALTEMAVSSSDPDTLSSQVDAVAEGISATEQTIRDLQTLTGMSADAAEAPSILGADVATISQKA